MGKVVNTKPRQLRPYSAVLTELVPLIAEIESDEESEFEIETFEDNDLTVHVTMNATTVKESKLLVSHGADKSITGEYKKCSFLIITGIHCPLQIVSPEYQQL